ncbi:MAG: ABC transporter ATP-binding protein [Acidimicrobiia bacterium]|nr:ABC transporter ATP-binding protein [Acidimicrobiia bacterium]
MPDEPIVSGELPAEAAGRPGAPLAELRHVSKRFGQGAVGAVDVTLGFPAGRMVALFGPSGSGKTTVLHMLGLLLPPDEGEIWLDGRRVDGLAEGASAAVRRRSLGFVFQSFGLVPLLTAEENVTVALRLLNIGGDRAREKARAALEVVDLGRRAGHRPAEMSGGEQQRVALARALVHSPKLLLADEPTGELDTATGAYVLDLLRRTARNGAAVVLATHDPAALEVVDTAYFMRDGTVHEPDRAELELWLTEGEGGLAGG